MPSIQEAVGLARVGRVQEGSWGYPQTSTCCQPVSIPVDMQGLIHISNLGGREGQTTATWPLWPFAPVAPAPDEMGVRWAPLRAVKPGSV